MIPGETRIQAGELVLNEGRETVSVVVANTGDRPIQVGSHYHFYETNPCLQFDREKARGFRLNMPQDSCRFEPGQERTVELSPCRVIDRLWFQRARHGPTGGLVMKISRKTYADLYGPLLGILFASVTQTCGSRLSLIQPCPATR